MSMRSGELKDDLFGRNASGGVNSQGSCLLGSCAIIWQSLSGREAERQPRSPSFAPGAESFPTTNQTTEWPCHKANSEPSGSFGAQHSLTFCNECRPPIPPPCAASLGPVVFLLTVTANSAVFRFVSIFCLLILCARVSEIEPFATC